ncbi:MAG: Hsp20/alpha crystallin family protein [Desulforudis sp.]|nr:MAG: Hsp20/alpha crystallin family protein [Desulforudis sp.]
MRDKRSGSDKGGRSGLLGPLFDLVSTLQDMMDRGQSTVSRQGEIRSSDDKVRGMYGFTMRIGANRDETQAFVEVEPEKVSFDVEHCSEPVCELFDEGQQLRLVAELPGVSEENVQVVVEGDILKLSTTGERQYYKELLLPARVKAQIGALAMRNGVLEVLLDKEIGA